MFSRINFTNLVNYGKDLTILFKKNIVKFFSLIFYPNNANTNFLNKVISFHTKTINRYFITIIVIFCLITIMSSSYEQRQKFNLRLESHTKLSHSRIEETAQNYQKSLNLLTTVMLDERLYLESIKVLRLLKYSYIKDPYVSLLSLYWHPSSDPYKAFGALDNLTVEPDEILLTKLKENPRTFIYDQLDDLDIYNLILAYPVIEQNDLANERNLVGYLKMSVPVSSLLQKLYDRLDDDNVIKITHTQDDRILYFSKQNGSFNITNDLELNKYQFSDNLSFVEYPYKIAVGKNKEQIIANTLKTAGERCGIILAVGGLMLFVYNYVERKKAKQGYNENNVFVEEISSLQGQVAELSAKLNDSNNKIEMLDQQNQNYLASSNIINDIDQQIRQNLISSLIKIQDISQLKQHRVDKEVTPEMINKTLTSIYKISKDLIDNVVNRYSELVEVNLADLFKKLLTLFSSIVANNSLKFQQKIDKITILTNELLLKQVLVSLLSVVLCATQDQNNVKIFVKKDATNDNILVKLSHSGSAVSEQLLKSISNINKNDLPPGVTNIQLEIKSLENIVKEVLQGELKFEKQNNQITLSLPLKRNKYEVSDKVIDFYKIANK